MSDFEYPAQPQPDIDFFGLVPVDFILADILEEGLKWFRETPSAPRHVFGHLMAPWLEERYGEKKITEIANYIKKFDIKVVQSWALIAQNSPCFSIQLLDGGEEIQRAALNDHQGSLDLLDAESNVLGRENVGFSPITDSMHIGIHNIDTPDLTKYLYYLAIYILNYWKFELIKRNIHLGTFRASDISKLMEFLPENMYSRFINFSVFTIASYEKGAAPIVTKITGITVPPGALGHAPGEPEAPSDTASEQAREELEVIQGSLTLANIHQGGNENGEG